ncbi:MAG: cytochrome c3 family protein [Ghiorsea sp.]
MKLIKRDYIFIGIIAVVLIFLTTGAKERTTKDVPNNEMHNQVTSRAECLSCHGAEGVKPQPLGHPKANQCFQCHTQPEGWEAVVQP